VIHSSGQLAEVIYHALGGRVRDRYNGDGVIR
jgi:hypothetical protein